MPLYKRLLEIYPVTDDLGNRTGVYSVRLTEGPQVTYFPEGFTPTLYAESTSAEQYTARIAGVMKVISGVPVENWPAVDDPAYTAWSVLEGLPLHGVSFAGPERLIVSAALWETLADCMLPLSLHSKEQAVPPAQEPVAGLLANLVAEQIGDMG